MKLYKFKRGHRLTRLSFEWRLFRFFPSLYRYPFISVRWLGFELVHDWNEIGSTSGCGGRKVSA